MNICRIVTQLQEMVDKLGEFHPSVGCGTIVGVLAEPLFGLIHELLPQAAAQQVLHFIGQPMVLHSVVRLAISRTGRASGSSGLCIHRAWFGVALPNAR